jgi:hypothetical protein
VAQRQRRHQRAVDGTLQRPYARYVSNGTDTVHITYTEAHPRDFDNSIYHVYYKGGTLYRSDGTAIHPLTQGCDARRGHAHLPGDANNVAWTVDVCWIPRTRARTSSIRCRSDRRGCRPGRRRRHALPLRALGRDALARSPLAYAGTRLYSGEDDYTGLAAIDPTDPSVIYISTNANPTTGAALMSTRRRQPALGDLPRQHDNAGDSWQWTQ